MTIKRICAFFILLILSACEEQEKRTDLEENKIVLTHFELETTEPQAITQEGTPVLAPDINFGKIYFNWSTNFENTPYSYYTYLSLDSELDTNDNLLSSSSCNVSILSCWPKKQNLCEIVRIKYLECASNAGKALNLSGFASFPAEGLNSFFILKVCPWQQINHNDCQWQSRPIRIEPPCSDYITYECIDNFPLEIHEFQVKTSVYDEDVSPLLTSSAFGDQKLWLSWLSSWVNKPYDVSIELVHIEHEIEYKETLVSITCNDIVTCYPDVLLQCKYSRGNSTGSIRCLNGTTTVPINIIASNHPMEDVDLVIRLTAYNNEQSTDIVKETSIRVEAE